jgi:hypothetical protein
MMPGVHQCPAQHAIRASSWGLTCGTGATSPFTMRVNIRCIRVVLDSSASACRVNGKSPAALANAASQTEQRVSRWTLQERQFMAAADQLLAAQTWAELLKRKQQRPWHSGGSALSESMGLQLTC